MMESVCLPRANDIISAHVPGVPPDSAEVTIDFHELSVAEALDRVHDNVRLFRHSSESWESGHLAHGDPA